MFYRHNPCDITNYVSRPPSVRILCGNGVAGKQTQL